MDICCWFERLSWVTAFPRYVALNLKIDGYSGICKTHGLIVALYRELALLQLWTKWFWQCPLIFTFQRPRPAPWPLSEEPPSSTSVSVSQSGILSDSHVGLNCRLIVSKPQYFCGLTEVDGHRKEHVCLCLRICVFMRWQRLQWGMSGIKAPSRFTCLYSSLKTMAVQHCYCWTGLNFSLTRKVGKLVLCGPKWMQMKGLKVKCYKIENKIIFGIKVK